MYICIGLFTGRMFYKEKNSTTKGERDIMMGIFKNRGNSQDAHKLEYLIKHNYITSHADVWKVGESKQKGKMELIESERKKVERWKDEQNDNGGADQYGHSEIKHTDMKGRSQIISDKKYKSSDATMSLRSLWPPASGSKFKNRSGQRPFSANPSIAVHASKLKKDHGDLCPVCQVQLEDINSRRLSYIYLKAPPSSPEPDPWDTQSCRDENPNTDCAEAEEFQMVQADGKYEMCSSKKLQKKTRNQRSKKTNGTNYKHSPQQKSLNVYIPTDEVYRV